MPEPTTSVGGQIDLSDAPGDFSFDDLFASPTDAPQQPQAPAPSEPPSPPPQAAPPAPEEPFLRVSTGTVYKTREEAERGISAKDSAIERLRQYAVEKTGFDPLTGKQTQPQAAPQAEPDVTKSYWDSLVDAAQKGDKKRYTEVQSDFVRRQIEQVLAPVQPLITEVARNRAISTVSRSNAEVQQWIGSSEYNQFLEESPVLAMGIRQAEQFPQLYEQLPELYRTAYLAYQGRRLPDLLRQQQAQAAPASTPPPITTTPTSTTTPPAAGAPADPLASREGRKEFIERFERSAGFNQPLSYFGK